MAKYKRKWTCGSCHQDVFYDSETGMLSCGCGDVRLLTPWETQRHNYVKVATA